MIDFKALLSILTGSKDKLLFPDFSKAQYISLRKYNTESYTILTRIKGDKNNA